MPLRYHDRDRLSNNPTPFGLHVSWASSGGNLAENRIQPFKLQFKPHLHLRHRGNLSEHVMELG